VIRDDVEVRVLAIGNGRVEIGIDAPRSIPVVRRELYDEAQPDRAPDEE
jgi:carbon storage regulator